ncbi:MAG: hypothetical protein PV347_04445 [Rickettsiaceae bacterium]|nr:hypothetical protein [Rickettsiaceae bacterium]MDD9338016.1 hypothetical protein [Rickettsiaceae bacterium]
MFNKIFKKASTIRKHINAPLLEERLQYLQYWDTLGRSRSTIQSTAQYLLRIIDYLNLETNDVVVSRKKIELAAFGLAINIITLRKKWLFQNMERNVLFGMQQTGSES